MTRSHNSTPGVPNSTILDLLRWRFVPFICGRSFTICVLIQVATLASKQPAEESLLLFVLPGWILTRPGDGLLSRSRRGLHRSVRGRGRRNFGRPQPEDLREEITMVGKRLFAGLLGFGSGDEGYVVTFGASRGR